MRRVGRAAAEHLVATGNEVVVVDRDPARLADMCRKARALGRPDAGQQVLAQVQA